MNNPPDDLPTLPTALVAIDPGRDKCGLALVSTGGQVIERRIVAPSDVESAVRHWVAAHDITQIVLGDATTSQTLRARLVTGFPTLALEAVAEKNSTLEARDLYWQEHPPRGWRRLVPLSLQTPPVPVDDFAAVVLARRFLVKKTRSKLQST